MCEMNRTTAGQEMNLPIRLRDGRGARWKWFLFSSNLQNGNALRDGPASFTARWTRCEMEMVFLKVRICEMNRTTAGQEMDQRDECAR